MIAREHVDRRGRRRVTRVSARPVRGSSVTTIPSSISRSLRPSAPATPPPHPRSPSPPREEDDPVVRVEVVLAARAVDALDSEGSRLGPRRRRGSAAPGARPRSRPRGSRGPPRVSVSERVARGRETSRRRRSSRRHRSWRWLSAERHISGGAGRTIRPAGYGYRSLVASRCALAAIAAIRRGSGRRNPSRTNPQTAAAASSTSIPTARTNSGSGASLAAEFHSSRSTRTRGGRDRYVSSRRASASPSSNASRRRFEQGALLVAHGVHRSVESLVKPRQVEEVEPRGRDSRHGDMAHILAPQPVEERDRGVGRVGPANGAGLEPEPVEGAVGSDDSPS